MMGGADFTKLFGSEHEAEMRERADFNEWWKTVGHPDEKWGRSFAYQGWLARSRTQQALVSDGIAGARRHLARLIRERLLGVHPQDQDLELEDHDYELILAALVPVAPSPANTLPVQSEEPTEAEVERKALSLPVEQQHRLAVILAANCGMVVENEAEHPDQPIEPSPEEAQAISERLDLRAASRTRNSLAGEG